MKKILLIPLLLLFFSSGASAQIQGFRLTCSTPTTIVRIWTEHEYIIAQVHHPHGVQFTPFYKGQVSLFQMDQVSRMADIHRGLTTLQETQWPLEKCQFRLPYLVSCREGKLTIPEESDLNPYFMETSINTFESVGGVYESLNFRLGLMRGDDYHMLTSDYSAQMHCH